MSTKRSHILTLNYNGSRCHNVETSKIDFIKNIASSYKEKHLDNIVINVIDQSQKDTWVKLPSFVDLSRPILLVEHINY